MKTLESDVTRARALRDGARPALASAQRDHLLAPTSETTVTLMHHKAVDAVAVRALRTAEEALARAQRLRAQRRTPAEGRLDDAFADIA